MAKNERMTEQELIEANSLLNDIDNIVGILRSDIDQQDRLELAERVYLAAMKIILEGKDE